MHLKDCFFLNSTDILSLLCICHGLLLMTLKGLKWHFAGFADFYRKPKLVRPSADPHYNPPGGGISWFANRH